MADPSRPEADASRLVDVILSSLLLVVTAPLMAVVALLVRVQMGAPVLFRQERAGRGGRVFELVKFRTMRHPRPDQEGFRPDTDEDRLTGLGRFLRSTSLDELPSMLNVVRGQMALVGPRPLPVHYLPRYSEEHRRRHEVRPGVTGWAQVHGRNTLSWDDQLDMDVWYVDHRSLWLDLRILGSTAAAVLRRDGINQDGQATREEFGGSQRGATTA